MFIVSTYVAGYDVFVLVKSTATGCKRVGERQIIPTRKQVKKSLSELWS